MEKLKLTPDEQDALDYAWWILRCDLRWQLNMPGSYRNSAAHALILKSMELLAKLGADTNETREQRSDAAED